jgi:hypothetical protein
MSSRLDSLPLDAVRRIDELCDEFETALQAGRAPRIEEYLPRLDEAHQPALLGALLEVELEYRRAWGERPSPEEYLPRLPCVHAVLAAFGTVEAQSDEASVTEACLLQLALANASGRRTDRLRIYSRGTLVHTTTLIGPMELGRQRQGEAPPYAVTQGQHEPRLVIAPLEETTISRRHVRLIPEGDELVRVANLSQVNPILFPDGRRLEADQSEALPLTLEMTLGPLFLRIDRPGRSGDSDPIEESQFTEEAAEASPPERRLLDRILSWRRSS